jgi:hypothetical protein
MKLAILSNSEKLNVLPELRIVLDDFFIESRVWFLRKDAEDRESLESLEGVMEYSSYVMCIISEEDFNAPWVHFAIGYQKGRKGQIVFWINKTDSENLPAWTENLKIISGSINLLEEYFSGLEKHWNRIVNKSVARDTLELMKQDLTVSNFCRIVEKGDRFFTGLFLDGGFSAETRNHTGVPVLNLAVRNGHTDIVELLIRAGADINAVAQDRKTTPLMDASAIGNIELVRFFLSEDADLNAVSVDGQSAVTMAVGNGKKEVAVELIKKGADVDKPDMLGMSARKYAGLYKQEEILSIIEEQDEKRKTE